MRSIAPLLLLACLCMPPREAVAFRIEADYRQIRASANWASFSQCSGATQETGSGSLVAAPGVGLGVEGGLSDTDVDGGESLRVAFSVPRSGVAYRVIAASNVDGDEPGEGLVEIFDGSDASLGVFAVSGVGTIDLAPFAGGQPIGSFVLTAGLDGVRLRGFGYDLRAGEPMLAWFGLLAADVTDELVVCSVTVRAIGGQVYVHEDVNVGGGLGVTGGTDAYAELGEELDVEFPEPVAGASYTLTAAVDVDNDGNDGDHVVEAFGEQGQSLGLKSVPDEGPTELTDPAFFGDVLISRLRIVPTADRFRLHLVEFVPEPGGSAEAATLALLVVGWRSARRRRGQRGALPSRMRRRSAEAGGRAGGTSPGGGSGSRPASSSSR